MEIAISFVAILVALFFSSKVLLNIHSNINILKIGVYRTISKLLIGLGVGFFMGLMLNLTQQYRSVALELVIIIPSLLIAGFLSLKSYQYIVFKFTSRTESLLKLLIANISEILISVAIVAAFMFVLRIEHLA